MVNVLWYAISTMKIKFAHATPKIRKSWGVLNPVTRKINSKKLYKRNTKWGKNWD